jgi:hypothetical protein
MGTPAAVSACRTWPLSIEKRICAEPAPVAKLVSRTFSPLVMRTSPLPALASMDAFVFMVPGSDGTARALREAMALGLPVVAARANGSVQIAWQQGTEVHSPDRHLWLERQSESTVHPGVTLPHSEQETELWPVSSVTA